jgi:hypothetical protein
LNYPTDGAPAARRFTPAEQSLDDDDVLPDAADAGMSLVDADLAKADLAQQRSAGQILHEYPRHELPEAGRARRLDQRLHRYPAEAQAAAGAVDIDREFADAGVALPRPVFRRARERHHFLPDSTTTTGNRRRTRLHVVCSAAGSRTRRGSLDPLL